MALPHAWSGTIEAFWEPESRRVHIGDGPYFFDRDLEIHGGTLTTTMPRPELSVSPPLGQSATVR